MNQSFHLTEEYGCLKSIQTTRYPFFLAALEVLPKINRKDIARTSDYIGYLNAILFVPEDLSLVKGSPSARRQLLDQEISKISPIYMYNITKVFCNLKVTNGGYRYG